MFFWCFQWGAIEGNIELCLVGTLEPLSFDFFKRAAVIGYLPSAHLTYKALDMQWVVCLLDVLHVCALKENISGIFFKYDW